MKAYWGVEVYIHVFFASALVGGERSALRPGPLDWRLGGLQSQSGRGGTANIY